MRKNLHEKIFRGTIFYLKLATVFGLVMCVVLAFYQSFDPAGGLEMMIVRDLYGTDVMPAEARPMYVFVFLLFDGLSVVSLFVQYIVIVHGLEKKQRWAWYYMTGIGVFWPLIAMMIALYCGTPSYLVSAGMMAIMFFPPLLLLRKHFFGKDQQ